jgi:hypothetical protein
VVGPVAKGGITIGAIIGVAVAVGGATMAHVFARRGSVGAVCDGVIDTDATAVEVLWEECEYDCVGAGRERSRTYDSIEFLDAAGCLLDCCHFYEAKASGAV